MMASLVCYVQFISTKLTLHPGPIDSEGSNGPCVLQPSQSSSIVIAEPWIFHPMIPQLNTPFLPRPPAFAVISHSTHPSSSSHHTTHSTTCALHEDCKIPHQERMCACYLLRHTIPKPFVRQATSHQLPYSELLNRGQRMTIRFLARMISSNSEGGFRDNEALAITFRQFYT